MKLNEASRNNLINKSKSSEKGNQRYNRRKRSKVASNVRQFNSIDMNKLFKQDILTVDVEVKGETDDYTVRITFGGFLEILRDYIKNDTFTLRDIIRSLVTAFNRDDVYVFCTCPDWHYRFGYYASINKITSGEIENRPSNITNPDDKLGSACKHVLLVLSNTSWLVKVASVINNYIKYMEKHYQKLYSDFIYPAIYGKEYSEPVQLSFDDIERDNDELSTDKETIDKANEYNKRRTQFQKGNDSGIRFAPNTEDKNQLSLDLDKDI